jgi:hypothetical protein
MHPPNFGRTYVDYYLRLPATTGKIGLEFAVALQDKSLSDGLIFLVEANCRELFRQKVTAPDGWHEGRVGLTEFAGKNLLLSLIVDSDGPYSFDWARWGEPRIVER